VPGETETEIAGNVTFAEAVFVGSATEAATTATVTLLVGGVAGAEYVVDAPLAVATGNTVPHDAVGHDTDHLTPLLVESLPTLAVKFAVAPAWTVAAVWESDTLMGGGGGFEEPPPHPVRKIAEKYVRPAMNRLHLALIDFLQAARIDLSPGDTRFRLYPLMRRKKTASALPPRPRLKVPREARSPGAWQKTFP
jgi:hypothetical protein